VTSENNEQCFSDDQTMDRTNDRSGKPMLTGRVTHTIHHRKFLIPISTGLT